MDECDRDEVCIILPKCEFILLLFFVCLQIIYISALEIGKNR